MTDEKILKIRELLSDEIGSGNRRGISGRIEYAAHVRANANTRAKTKADIYLLTLSEAELNEFREIIAMGKYFDAATRKDHVRRIASFPWGHPEQIKRTLNVKPLTSSASIDEIRKISPAKIVSDIDSYFDIRSMSKIRRNFIRIICKHQAGRTN